jgi:hypothetical protein
MIHEQLAKLQKNESEIRVVQRKKNETQIFI